MISTPSASSTSCREGGVRGGGRDGHGNKRECARGSERGLRPLEGSSTPTESAPIPCVREGGHRRIVHGFTCEHNSAKSDRNKCRAPYRA